ncbi:hypothetical protein BEL04_05765 [Mucilaginibacter sp. PPCGB 2223]|uniref:putative signal transducing protein n=1 Tax=Mucilaginibacter sp. PPCGB 2223 TaxID=1886027 RepID=UPI00082655C5|nr:DUF2007 domain-containing protein [Mucilaginibacter sp. PPCGB 2223]OCX53792.1 hypothetical protein BEL04_05765 [Mucilaginibacter sp. PPCGB 2223]
MQNDDEIITFATYYDPMLAHIIRTRLEDSGIPCVVDDSMMSVYPIYSNATGGIKVKIFKRDLEKAKEVLADDGGLPVDKFIEDSQATSAVCPYCGSNNVRHALSDPNDANWLVRTISKMTDALPFGKDADWHCFNCGKDFE